MYCESTVRYSRERCFSDYEEFLNLFTNGNVGMKKKFVSTKLYGSVM
jgi:hypothetical protein